MYINGTYINLMVADDYCVITYLLNGKLYQYRINAKEVVCNE